MTTKKDINILVGQNIKREREQAGYTQEQFSELIGMGCKNLSAVERGTVGISMTMLKKICDVLRISSNALLSCPGERNDVHNLAERLEQLPTEQFEVVKAVVQTMLETYARL